MHITIYTDGSSRGNPGPGGWGAIIILEETRDNRQQTLENAKNDRVIELGGREDLTTNNRMELRGAIEGLRYIGNLEGVKEVLVKTDSEYVKKGMTEWITGWIARGWKTAAKKPVLNQELWQELLKQKEMIVSKGGSVTFEYVQAHVGITLNERADTIATSFADKEPIELFNGKRSSYKE
jgi:ribonuclease HI